MRWQICENPKCQCLWTLVVARNKTGRV